MTEGTCKKGLQVARLDRTQPPPGFDVLTLRESLRKTIETAGVWGPNALAAAWAIHEAAHDPPGLTVNAWGFGQRAAEQP